MSYYFNKLLHIPFAEAVQRAKEALKSEGFGVLSEIDVQKAFREKLDIEYPPYLILGACSPKFAYRALQIEEKIGTMLPCNIIVQDKGEKGVEISVIDPEASMRAVNNDELMKVATQVRKKLASVIENL